MRVMVSFIFMMLLSISLFGTTKPQIRGAYLETRSADVYVGQCFANGEMNFVGVMSQAFGFCHCGLRGLVRRGLRDGLALQCLRCFHGNPRNGRDVPHDNPSALHRAGVHG